MSDGSKQRELKILLVIVGLFLVCYFLPVSNLRFSNALLESLQLVKWYAREHVLLCLIPAFFIAGGIAVFIRREAVLKYLGANAHPLVAYGVASISGAILAVCSCTVLPLFAGIYRMGAGLGPATTFLYAGPAINILAIILTARVLGFELGLARAIGSIVFGVVIGVMMQLIFRNSAKNTIIAPNHNETASSRTLAQTALYFAAMVGVLVFANWSRPAEGQTEGAWVAIFHIKWILVGASLFILLLAVLLWFGRDDVNQWAAETWSFTKQILPLLLLGVLAAGFFLGRPGGEGIIPQAWVQKAVGGNSIWANLFSAVAGAFMYFATLTEIPIVQGLIGSGMGKGPALALLLAGPALSLPNMLVIRSVLGTMKTVVFVVLVIVMATISGIIYGTFFG
ncbi:MAG: permease [Sedimentisphaerales bacterium]|nr:permease [Sedimentisphaerales bacterium]